MWKVKTTKDVKTFTQKSTMTACRNVTSPHAQQTVTESLEVILRTAPVR